MSEYIFGIKNNINIIDLQKTASELKVAMDFIRETVASGQDILLVGTKKQAKKMVGMAARRCGMPYVIERWLGGTFTNFPVISERTKYLREGQGKIKTGGFAQYTKFEQMKIEEELDKLEKKMGGIKNMLKLPAAIFVTGVIEDDLAIKEAKRKNIPVIALTDTNVDPSSIDYPIPSNEDAISSLRLMLSYITKAVLEGKEKRVVPQQKEAGSNIK
jgi:small subunit ribosomal protein S2